MYSLSYSTRLQNTNRLEIDTLYDEAEIHNDFVATGNNDVRVFDMAIVATVSRKSFGPLRWHCTFRTRDSHRN